LSCWATSPSKKVAPAGAAFRVSANKPITLLANKTIRVDLQLAPVTVAVAPVWDLRLKIIDGTDFYVVVTSLNAVFKVIFGTFEQCLDPCDTNDPALDRLRFMFHIRALRQFQLNLLTESELADILSRYQDCLIILSSLRFYITSPRRNFARCRAPLRGLFGFARKPFSEQTAP
jgi:hypothetical protein